MISCNTIPETPSQLHVELPGGCNLACGFCPVHRMTRGERLSFAELLDVVRQAAAMQVDYLDFVNYNESLISREFWHLADAFNQIRGPGHLGVVTNGTVMSRETALRVLGLCPRQVVFSVDAVTPETYAKVRPVWRDGFPVEDLGLRDRVYRNIELYLDVVREIGSHAWPVVQMTVCDANAHEVDGFRVHWSTRSASQVIALNCTGRGGERAFTTPNDSPCRAILDGLWVFSDGRVVACCEDWDGASQVGDVRKESLSRTWNGPRLRTFREAHFAGRKRDVVACARCQTSQDVSDHNQYPRNTRPDVVAELRTKEARP